MVPIGVIHGRFQPLHIDHVKYIKAGMAECEFMFVGITNPDPGMTREDSADDHRASAFANPCTYYERELMVRKALWDEGYPPETFCVVPFPINYPELWRYYVPQDATYFLTIYDAWGERKQELLETAGLRTRILWRKPAAEKGIIASQVRQKIVDNQAWHYLVPAATRAVIERFDIETRLKQLALIEDDKPYV